MEHKALNYCVVFQSYNLDWRHKDYKVGIVGCLVLNGNVKVLCSLKILPFTIDVTDFSSSNNKVILVTVIVKCLNIAIGYQ